MVPGQVEVVYSTQEKIGLPDWSYLKIFAAAKTSVPLEQYDALYDYFHAVVDTFMKESVQRVCEALNAWGGIESQILTAPEKAAIMPQGITMDLVELTVSRSESVGLKNKSSVDHFGSAKVICRPGEELSYLDAIYAKAEAQCRAKRDLILANPRPWTTQR